MYAMTQGDDKIALNYYRDRDWYEEAITSGSQSTQGEKQQRGDHMGHSKMARYTFDRNKV